MVLLGVTGGIGMGKSACAELLRARHVPVVDTDELARQVVEPGQPALAEVEAAFGPGLIGADGRLRRAELAGRVFSDPAARKSLEAILHPRIRALWLVHAEQWRRQGVPLGAVIIPLLFETQAERDLDITLCVACSTATQRQRLSDRGWSADEIKNRNSAQMPVTDKLARSDFVIWTEGSLDIHDEQLRRILDTIAS